MSYSPPIVVWVVLCVLAFVVQERLRTKWVYRLPPIALGSIIPLMVLWFIHGVLSR